MDLHVLYVEDQMESWTKVCGALCGVDPAEARRTDDCSAPSAAADGFRFHLHRAWVPGEVRKKLGLHLHAVLTDVYLPSSRATGDYQDRLQEVLEKVQAWTAEAGSQLPIVAYTDRGKETLQACLAHREWLFDIWDKNSVSADYLRWRMTTLAADFARVQADNRVQAFIRQMGPRPATDQTDPPPSPRYSVGCPAWHEQIRDTAKVYANGRTEAEQIQGCQTALLQAAGLQEVDTVFTDPWETMVKWEFIDRATRHRVRGHVRHAINVFWMGYLLLHDEHLHGELLTLWREQTGADAAALDRAWFLAALLHDAGLCRQSIRTTAQTVTDNVLAKLPEPFAARLAVGGVSKIDALRQAAQTLWERPALATAASCQPLFDKALQEPNHGAVSAYWLLAQHHGSTDVSVSVEQAALAALLHDLGPKVGTPDQPVLKWGSHMLACLLAVCDQLQTWDRQPDGVPNTDIEHVQRAELLDLRIDAGPVVHLVINYIPDEAFARLPQWNTVAKGNLMSDLTGHPQKGLGTLDTDWPFTLKLNWHFDLELVRHDHFPKQKAPPTPDTVE